MGKSKIHSFKLFIPTIFFLGSLIGAHGTAEKQARWKGSVLGKEMPTSPYFQPGCLQQFGVEGFLLCHFSAALGASSSTQ